MRVYDNGAFYTVTVSESDIDAFARRWPGSGLRGLRGVAFQYAKKVDGDLVDVTYKNGDSERWDGAALVALSHDAQRYGESHLGAKPRKKAKRAR